MTVRDKYELRTPLFAAVKENHIECVRYLLEHGAVANVRDVSGWTAHTRAIFRGHIRLAALLQEHMPVSKPSDYDLSSVVSENEHLDVTSFIDKSGPFRARGHEKTVDLGERLLGHEYLTSFCRVFIDVVSFTAHAHYDDPLGMRLKLRECNLHVSVGSESDDPARIARYYEEEGNKEEPATNASRSTLIALPLSEDGQSVTIDLPEQVRHHRTCRVEFRLKSAYDDRAELGRGSLVRLAWQDVHQQHGLFECELFSDSLVRVGRVSFRLLLATPYVGHSLSVSRENTFWKQQRVLPVWGHRGSGATKAAHVSEVARFRTHVQVCGRVLHMMLCFERRYDSFFSFEM